MNEADTADSAFKELVAPLASQLRPSFLLEPGEKLAPVHVITDEILRSEHAPKMLSYLAEHDDEFQRIASLQTPLAIQREMAKLEGRLEGSAAVTAGASSEPAVSKASPPLRPVKGSPHTDSGELDDNAPLSAYVQRFGERELRSTR